LKRRALDDPEHDAGCKPEIAAGSLTEDLAHGWRIGVLEPPSESVGQVFFRKRRDEAIGAGENRLSQAARSNDPGPIGQNRRRVYRLR
jgi:hypothetical protein